MLVIAISIDLLVDAVWTKINCIVYSPLIALDAVEPSFFNGFVTDITDIATKVISPHNVGNEERLLVENRLTQLFEKGDRAPEIQIIRVC